MRPKKAKRVREQVVVYLDKQDRAILEEMAKKTGLARTELFRRGLWRLAGETLKGPKRPGFSIDYLIENAVDDGLPADVSERHDYYLYGGGYEKWFEKKKANARKKRARIR
jgi:hypothetical protein